MGSIRNQNTFNRIAGGLLLVVVSLFCLISHFGAFGGVGVMVSDFLLGVFGFASYAYFTCLLILGFAVIFALRATLPPLRFLKYISLFFIGLYALQIYTSSGIISGRNYSEYLTACFENGSTAGGALLGVASFPLMRALTNAGALIATCIGFLALSFLYFYPLIKNEVTYKAKKSKIGSPKQPTLIDFSSMESEGAQAKLYRIDIDAAPLEEDGKRSKKIKGADGYNMLFPNERGHIEDEAKINNEQPYNSSGLAKKILLSNEFDEDAYKKYTKNSSVYINQPSAPYAVQKRIMMDGRLGIDRTGSGLKVEADKRFNYDNNRLNDSSADNKIKNAENSEIKSNLLAKDSDKSEQPTVSTDALDFSERKKYSDFRDESEWGEIKKEIPHLDLKTLKEQETMRFKDASKMLGVENEREKHYFSSNTKNSSESVVEQNNALQSANADNLSKNNIANYNDNYNNNKNDNYDLKKSYDEKFEGNNKQSDSDKVYLKSSIVETNPDIISPAVSKQSFGTEKLRDAVLRAVGENKQAVSQTDALSKSERLEKLEKMREARLNRIKDKPTDNTEKIRAAQITMDESIEKTIVKSPYVAPPLSLLKDADPEFGPVDDIDRKKDVLVATLASFNIAAKVINVVCGPTFSLYVLQVTMPKGKTINWISVLDHDIAMKMEEVSVRILAPIPGKNAVGIEVPNKNRRVVRLKEILNSPKFNDDKSPFTFALGKNLYGEVFTSDIKKLPHLLIAGATGAGKSCCINSLLVSWLYKATPDDLRLILIDPKRVELKVYEKIPHLLMDEIIVDVDKAIKALQWVIKEMDRRTEFFSKNSYRDIDEYNYYGVRDGFPKMPRIAIVIDELADLMDLGKKAVEDSINRLARLARATGIHLIVATQRPSVDVISGTIKNNLPTRIAFKVTSGPDSKTVLDGGGADKLLGNGDMLFMRPSSAMLDRIQGAFITGEEVRNVVKFILEHNKGYFDEKAKEEIFSEEKEEEVKNGLRQSNRANELPIEFFKALQIGLSGELISVTLLQRRMRIGFPKAGNIVDQLQARRFLGEADGSNKGRKVLITKEQFDELLKENNLTEDDLY